MRSLTVFLLVLFSCMLHAQRDLEISYSDPKRIALVIGNGAYKHANPLTNTLNDADAITKILKSVGFTVILVKNASLQELENNLNEFSTRIESGKYTVALCFYSGHGVQVNGENYIIPVDANPQREADVKYQCLNAQQIIDHMNEARAATKIMLLDACRTNPFPKTWNKSGGKGLAYMHAPEGTFIGFATAPGTEASDGIGNNSPYTTAILKYLNTPGLDIHQVFTRVANQTRELAAQEGKTQTPFINSNLTGDFYFVRSKTTTDVPEEPDSDNDGIPDHFDQCPENPGNVAYKGCPYPPFTVETVSDSLLGVFVLIKGGTFELGSEKGSKDELPVHSITLSDFYLGQTEVTLAQWQAVMETNPNNHKNCQDCPVEGINWHEAHQFISKLNQLKGDSLYRLPTEVEWEFAARGGNYSLAYTYAGSNDIDKVAWYDINSGDKVHPVKTKDPNELGLYDMSGNASEWCSSEYRPYPLNKPSNTRYTDSPLRVLRGGSAIFSMWDCRNTCRRVNKQYNKVTGYGIRLVQIKAN